MPNLIFNNYDLGTISMCIIICSVMYVGLMLYNFLQRKENGFEYWVDQFYFYVRDAHSIDMALAFSC
jgi:hypothetical protein